jgi:hypothetical protein
MLAADDAQLRQTATGAVGARRRRCSFGHYVNAGIAGESPSTNRIAEIL